MWGVESSPRPRLTGSLSTIIESLLKTMFILIFGAGPPGFCDPRDTRSSDVPGARDGDSNVFSGRLVGIREVDDHAWQVSFMEHDLGFFDKEQERVEPVLSEARSADRRPKGEAAKPPFNPFTPDRVLTMCPK